MLKIQHYFTGAQFTVATPTVLLPHTNLPLMLPLLQNEPLHNFSVKDQHLLKPPPAMGTAGGFGRRASDGGANLQNFFQKNIEQSDWTVQQQQNQQHVEKMQQHNSRQQPVGQAEALQCLNPLQLNGLSTSSHIAGDAPNVDSSEEPPNPLDLARFSIIFFSRSFVLLLTCSGDLSFRNIGTYTKEVKDTPLPWLVPRKLMVFSSPRGCVN